MKKKANYAERFIQTIKNKIYRYIVEFNDERYIDVLDAMVEAYNNKFHSGIGIEPINVNYLNASQVWWQMYLPVEFYEGNIPQKPKKPRFKFQIFDTVRVSLIPELFDRKYDQKWSTEVFLVKERFWIQNLPLYKLMDISDKHNDISGTFYQNELQKVNFDPDKLFAIEKVFHSDSYKRGRETYVKVKWKGWSHHHNSYVKKSELKNYGKKS